METDCGPTDTSEGICRGLVRMFWKSSLGFVPLKGGAPTRSNHEKSHEYNHEKSQEKNMSKNNHENGHESYDTSIDSNVYEKIKVLINLKTFMKIA